MTVAVDATAAVVGEVRRGLLLAHHPLLLRGVDTVAADTAKGALMHRMIRTGRALFTAHTNADSASPGVSDALADALGLTVADVLSPMPDGPDDWTSGWSSSRRRTPRRCASAMFAAGAGQIGDYSQCSWSVSGHRAVPAARRRGAGRSARSAPSNRSPRIGSRWSRPAPRRAAVLAGAAQRASLRGARLRHLRAGAGCRPMSGLGRIATLPSPEPLSAFVSRVRAALPATSWGVRACG